VVADATKNRVDSASARATSCATNPVRDFHATSATLGHNAHEAVTTDTSETTRASAKKRTGKYACMTVPDFASPSWASTSTTRRPRTGRCLSKRTQDSSMDDAPFTPRDSQGLVTDGSDETSQVVRRQATRRISRLMPDTSAIPQAGRNVSMTIEAPTPTKPRAGSGSFMTSDVSAVVELRAGKLASKTVEISMSSKVRSGRHASTTVPDFIPATREHDAEKIHGLPERQRVRGATAPLPSVMSTTTSADTGAPHRHAGRQVTIKDALIRYSFDLGLPMGLVSQAHDIFIEHSELAGDGHSCDLAEGKLEYDRFSQVVCKLADVDDPDKLPTGLLQDAFDIADQDGNDEIDFSEFAMWYSKYGFSESLVCSKEQRELRELARKLGLTISAVENLKSSFDRFDADGSGAIDVHEFEDVLRVLMKIPRAVQIPPCRVRQFWAEVNIKQDGEVSFEEFLFFYLRHFGCDGIPPTASAFSSYRCTAAY